MELRESTNLQVVYGSRITIVTPVNQRKIETELRFFRRL